MFSGIVETTSDILKVVDSDSQRAVQIRKPRSWKLRAGESVCVDGVCSTVQRAVNASFQVTYMPETLRRTTLRNAGAGDYVNLERSLRLASLLGGHLVQGHVDTEAVIQGIWPEGEARIYELKVPRRFSRYIVEKGSIAVHGVSLTITGVRQGTFRVSLLGYTLSRTTLGSKKPGQRVNIEVDVLAKYVEKLLSR